MELFRADLHIHSRFSRATSKGLTARLLAAWARIKGLDVLGTGDFTHPGWLAELKDLLAFDARTGLYALKDGSGLQKEVKSLPGVTPSGKTLFMLQAEISSIYKRGGKVRKVHNLVYMPHFEAAEAFNAKLGQVGNLTSDGRPILGLDSRILLEMVLDTDPLAFLIPAHIWTPWFSLFGSKSGFDSIEECFGELSSEIFALETGLSSDPEMNWTISALDRFRLISNSDAHSAEKLGRESNLFSGAPSYEGIYRALRGQALGHKFLGTVEFFPEEGKYHLDGHRKCGVVYDPRETVARSGICPVCGKPLTLGVLHRVLELADRETAKQPAGQPGYVSLVPLTEVLSEILSVGPASKKVKAQYAACISRFGSETHVLQDAPLEDLAKVSPLLAESIKRMRAGEVYRQPGFDGEYGVIRLFSPRERSSFGKGQFLSGFVPQQEQSAQTDEPSAGPAQTAPAPVPEAPATLNPSQERAVQAGPGPVAVVAGPGTGKTHTLISRVFYLLGQGAPVSSVLTVTFTRRAAEELENRIAEKLERDEESAGTQPPRADTLHALALEYWAKSFAAAPVLMSEDGAFRVFCEANSDVDTKDLRAAWKRIELRRESMIPQDRPDEEIFHRYLKLKESWNLADYTDLLEFWLEQIQQGIYPSPFSHVLVDELQDLTRLQLEVVMALADAAKGKDRLPGQGFFAIGDPNQSIYGFRGAQPQVVELLQERWPLLEVVALEENYRSAAPILEAAAGVLQKAAYKSVAPVQLVPRYKGSGTIRLFDAPTAGSESAWIAERIRWLIGATSHTLTDERTPGLDSADSDDLRASLSPGDVAVLVRFKALIPPIKKSLERLGLPCTAPENEAFWMESRVGEILDAAGSFLGIAHASTQNNLIFPDKILAKGPLAVQAYLEDSPRFDRLFWQSREFRELAKAYARHGGWAGLLNWVNLQSELDLAAKRSEKIRIMSLHSAKGLEFRAVFMPCLEEGVLPFAGPSFLSGKPDISDRPDTEEERRLFYVGLTRARDALFLSHSGRRNLFGRELRLHPSSFLGALPEALLNRTTLKTKIRHKEQQLNLM